MKAAVPVVLMALTLPIAPLEAVVVEDENIEFFRDAWPGPEQLYNISIYSEVGQTDETVGIFEYDGTNLDLKVTLLDEGSNWYVVENGDAFSVQEIAAGQFPVIFAWPDSSGMISGTGTAAVGADGIYLGVTTSCGLMDPPPAVDCGGLSVADQYRNVLGWVYLRDTGSELEMIDNAVAYGHAGIVAGTSIPIPVPEPAGLALVLCGASLLARRRRGVLGVVGAAG